MNKRLPVLIVLLTTAAGGCGVHRPYTAPVASVPATWASPITGTGRDTTDSVSPTLAEWWVAFGDQTLTDLVRQATNGSLDVRTAVSRLREARASIRSARSGLLPTADASGSARFSDSAGGPGGVTRNYGLGLDASWELDVFGGIQSGVDAANATFDARQADLQDVLISLAAETALDYIDVRSLQRRLQISRSNVDLQRETLELTQFRAQAGLATDLDVQQARANVENTQAQIASLESQLSQARHALAVLLGRQPSDLDITLAAVAPIPESPVTLAVGVPAEALRRRPDVRSAERQVAAQFAQVNAARADLYPSFRLAGSIGLESLSLAKLLVPGSSLIWSGSPTVSTRVFNREQLRANLTIQTERQEQALATYESRVLGALQEVEDALTALAREEERLSHLTAAADAAQRAADLSLQLYNTGLRDFRDVLDAQRSLLSLQDSMATSTASVSSDMVRLYKAVGGGWSTSSTVPAALTGS